MRFAETLLPSGQVDQSSLRAAKQTDVFILRGRSAAEIFEPKFTYHGFRYVQICGLPTVPTADSCEGLVIHSDLPMTGRLRIDHALIDRIWRNTVWTQRSNFTGTPTDCPQRDERRAYPGDVAAFWDAAAFNMDVAAFTRRYLEDARDSRTPEGVYQTHAPTPIQRPDPFPGWADGVISVAWTAWRRYADVTVIEENWVSMNRHVQFLLEHNPDCLWRNRRADYGDWLSVDEKYTADPTTPHDLLGTAFWANDLAQLAQMAGAIGRQDEAASLQALHGRVRQAFIEAFVKPDGRIGNGSQTSYLLALKYGLVPQELEAKSAAWLAADIRQRGGALSTGILGTQYILDVLSDAGYVELAHDLLLRTDYPSWGYMIAHGATTIWESWNGRLWAGLKGDMLSMPNSHNHFALGAICGFLFRRVAGIDLSAPGFEEIVIRPALDARVKRGGGDYDSIVGRISTDWAQLPGCGFTLNVLIPANAHARVHLPARPDQRIEENGHEIANGNDLRVLNRSDREIVLEMGSGRYSFVVQGQK